MISPRLTAQFKVAFAGQTVTLAGGIVMSLLVPRLIGVTEFGYWQLFLFYASYAGFFHLGLNDGVYLIHGGEEFEALDKPSIGSQLRLGMSAETCMSAVLMAIAVLFFQDSNKEIVIIFVAVYLILYNCTYYIGFVFQAVNQIHLHVISVTLARFSFILAVGLLACLHVTVFLPYVLCYVMCQALALVFMLWRGRSIVSARFVGWKRAVRDTAKSIQVGVKLMIANIASTLVLGVGRFGVEFKWGIAAFGQFSLALSFGNMILSFVQQLTMVLFPELRRSRTKDLPKAFALLTDVLAVAAPFILLLYYPGVLLLRWWLPQYSDTARYFGVLLPLCLFDARMSAICVTYYKVVRQERKLLITNLLTMLVSVVGVVLAITLTGSIMGVAGCLVAVIALRSVVAEHDVGKQLGIRSSREVSALVALSLAHCLALVFLPSRWALLAMVALCLGYLFSMRAACLRLYSVVSHKSIERKQKEK
ncbi:MAG: hypothetical protein LBI84_08225 [Propionibacteriaceae bacterium]|jgi:O-antigen/teichoic acid export membrane protein|nr:hypothetical protein [Propionibacteriaceae bacterium]